MNREPAIVDDIFYRSLRHDMICAYHLAPASDFVLDEGCRFGRRAAVRLDIERAKALLHIRHRRVARLVQHRQDLELAVEIKRERPRYVAEEDIDALP